MTMFDGKNLFHQLHLQNFEICNEEGLSICEICKQSLQILGKLHMATSRVCNLDGLRYYMMYKVHLHLGK